MYRVRRRQRPAGHHAPTTSATNDAPKFDIMDLSGCRPRRRRRAPFPPSSTPLPRARFDFSPGQWRLPPRRGQGRPGGLKMALFGTSSPHSCAYRPGRQSRTFEERVRNVFEVMRALQRLKECLISSVNGPHVEQSDQA